MKFQVAASQLLGPQELHVSPEEAEFSASSRRSPSTCTFALGSTLLNAEKELKKLHGHSS